MDIRKGKHWRYPFQFNQTVKIILLGVAALFFVLTINQFKFSNHFPIKTVRIYGASRIDHQEIQSLLLPLVNHGFFKINIDLIRDRMLQLPWVGDIVVRRQWPNQLEVTIIEKKAVARWNHQGLLSDHGEIFSPEEDTYPTHLPDFVGPISKQLLMLEKFNEMNRLLSPLHVKISLLELSSYDSWKMKLDNGMLLQIGHKDILTRLYHFVKVYPKAIGLRAKDVEYVDLRYPNGMAVQWKVPIKT